MEVLDNWIADLPAQFIGKENIEVLIGAFAEQMQELADVFDDLNISLEIDTASGKNLDRIGDIICMSRSNAYTVLRGTQNDSIGDDMYRKVLKWKLLKNTCECTYADVMKSLELIWGVENLTYTEDSSYPATIILGIYEYDLDDEDPSVGRGVPIKAAGVAVIFLIGYITGFDESDIEHIDLVSIGLAVRIYFFWSTRYLNGMELWDGSNYLDSVRGYELRFGIGFGVELKNLESNGISFTITMSTGIDANIEQLGSVFTGNGWILLDGEYSLDSSFYLTALVNHEEVE